MERLASQLQALLRGAVAERDAPISQLPLLTPAARAQLVHGFNETRRPRASRRASTARPWTTPR
jgi:hypothetical protein